MIGILGDIHAHYVELFHVVSSHPEITSWIQVGDLGAEESIYPFFNVPFYFISGNHENWDEIEKMDKGLGPKNLIHIKNGETVIIEGLKVLGFGGNYSPKYFNADPKTIPSSRRRHNNHTQLEHAITQTSIDLFICHESPKPYVVRDKDAGIETLNTIIAAVKPRLCFFGHHHYVVSKVYEGVTSECLEYGWKSFYQLDPTNLSYNIKKVD
jgi:Icc-related predicted phosphoesterase